MSAPRKSLSSYQWKHGWDKVYQQFLTLLMRGIRQPLIVECCDIPHLERENRKHKVYKGYF